MTGSPASPSLTLEDLDAQFVQVLQQVLREELDHRRRDLAPLGPDVVAQVDAVEGFLDGGKLLRPRFCLLGGLAALGRMPQPQEVESLARLGAAIELVQAAALIHDDVIDHSPMRRGRPAVHEAARQRHQEQHLAGDSTEYGVAVAVVLGDLALAWAEQAAAAVTTPTPESTNPAALARARAEFDLVRTEVMGGQLLDVMHQAGAVDQSQGAEAAALQVIRWKTVPYTVERPLRMGAALMGGSDALLEELTAWAIDVGTAFQLRDDLLSIVGDARSTGKPVGGDLIEGKRTVVLARALAALPEESRVIVEGVLAQAQARDEQVREACSLMVSCGAVSSVGQEVRERCARAEDLLRTSQLITDPVASGLQALAARATDLTSLGL